MGYSIEKRIRQTASKNMLGWLTCFLTCVGLLLISGCGGGGASDSGGLSATSSSVGSGTGEAILTWDAPTTRSDGSTLTDLAGYRIYYGTSSPVNAQNSEQIDVGNTTGYTLTGLEAGTYYFTATAYDAFGNESAFSQEASKIISGI